MTSGSLNTSRDHVPGRSGLGILTVRDLTQKFGDLTAFEHLSFTVQEGEFLCIVGPSGCGKSTLLLSMAGLNKSNTGEVSFRGGAVSGPSIERGVVFQEYALFKWMNVFDNVGFGLRMMKSLSAAEYKSRVEEYLDLVGLRDFATYWPHQLSGGMRQRVAIARSLAVKPSVLLMDEPFGALDALTRRDLQRELLKIWQLTKMTVIFVTHNLHEALFLADRVLCLTRRPAHIKREIVIGAPRPRDVENPTAEIKRIIEDLQDALYSEIDGSSEKAS